jgi:FimV-like protein
MNLRKLRLYLLSGKVTSACFAIGWCSYCIWLPLLTHNLLAATNTEQNYGPVQTNETLWRIATRLHPPDVSTAQMAVALQQANPRAFVDGDIHQLLAGAILQIPSPAEIRRISPAQAAAQFQVPPDTPPPPPVTSDPAPPLPKPVATPTNPLHTTQPLFAPWMFWSGCAAFGLVILLGMLTWRKRSQETAYPATFAASASLTPIPVPARAQPDWLTLPQQDTAPVTEALPDSASPLSLAPPGEPIQRPIRADGIQVDEYPDIPSDSSMPLQQVTTAHKDLIQHRDHNQGEQG